MTRNKAIIPVVVLIAAAAAFWFLLLAPKREEAASLAGRVSKAEQSAQLAESTAAQYAGSRASYRENYTSVARLGKALPADDDVRSLLVQIDATAKDSKVEFETIGAGEQSASAADATTAGPVPPPGAVPFGAAGMSAMPFAFGLSGKYRNLTGFLGELERFVTVGNKQIKVNGRLLRIESISLRPGSTGLPSLHADVNATSYLMPVTADIEAAPDTAAAPAAPTDANPSTTPQTPAVITAPTGALR